MHDSSRILVTGANGQVGHELLRALTDRSVLRNADAAVASCSGHSGADRRPEPGIGLDGRENRFRVRSFGAPRSDEKLVPETVHACAVIPATRNGTLDDGARCESIDLADFNGMAKALDRIAPDIIINAAAYTAVDRAEDEPELAQRINGDALGVLGAWAKQHSARVVHYSTDYVFDGSATRPYRETDATHPVSVYGASKLAGEIALRDSGARHLVFRTAWVYAARGQNFLRTMLRLGAERDALRVVDDQIGAPTPARLIAEVTAEAIAQWCTPPAYGRGGAAANARAARTQSGGGMPAPDGTYHLVASGQTSWCGFARAIFERAQHAGLIERAPVVHAIGTADYPTRAKRPAFSVLDTTRLHDTFGITLPDWRAGLDDVMRELADPRS